MAATSVDPSAFLAVVFWALLGAFALVIVRGPHS
jgi:hypothetical protein